MYQPVFDTAQIATIAANVAGTGFLSQELQAEGMRSFQAVNLTDVVLYVLDERNTIVGVLPPQSDIAQVLVNLTRYLKVQYDPARSGSTVAFTSTNAWNVYLEASPYLTIARVNEA